MEIKVTNNIPGIKVTVNQHENGNFDVMLTKEEKTTLANIKPGSIIKLGNREFIVLGHDVETTAVITKDFVKKMSFGDTGNYETSDVRKFCNGEFLNELADAIGMENIVAHIVNLMADNGTGKDKNCKDKVTIITTENYRRYREFLKPYGDSWWTATRVDDDDDYYARYVCCVDASGVMNRHDSGRWLGIRPFCIVNSSIFAVK